MGTQELRLKINKVDYVIKRCQKGKHRILIGADGVISFKTHDQVKTCYSRQVAHVSEVKNSLLLMFMLLHMLK